MPIGFPGYKQETSSLGYDLQLAQEELAAFDNAKRQHRIEFSTYLWGQFEEEVNILSSGWSESLDIQMIYVPLVENSYWKAMDEGTLQVIGFYIKPSYPDPYAVLGAFESIFGAGDSSPENVLLQSLLREAATEIDAAARLEKYSSFEQHLLDDAIVLPIRWRTGQTMVHRFQPWVHGFEYPKYPGSIFKDVWLDETAPDRELPLP